MNVQLTPDQSALVTRAIESGRFNREEEAVHEALWEERERSRLELVAALDQAEASLARGEGRTIRGHALKAFADDIKQRGRRRIETIAHSSSSCATAALSRSRSPGIPGWRRARRVNGNGGNCLALASAFIGLNWTRTFRSKAFSPVRAQARARHR